MDYESFIKRLSPTIALEQNVNGAKLSTFRSGGSVRVAIYPRDLKELKALTKVLKSLCLKPQVLGRGSDTLIVNAPEDSPMICTKKLIGDVNVKGNEITVCGGNTINSVARVTENIGVSCFERLVGIPGSIGGMIVMNGGAFGLCIADILKTVTFFCPESGDVVTLPARDIPFGYRSTSGFFKGKIIIGASFEGCHSDREKIQSETRKILEKRQSTQPNFPSLGSTFLRVNGVSAGYYIEEAGLKGTKIGGAEISPMHAGFIVNSGGATPQNYLDLMRIAKEKVKNEFGIDLVPEVEVIDSK